MAGLRGAFLIAGAFLPVVALLAYPRLRRLDAAAQVPAGVLALLLDVPLLAVLPPRAVGRATFLAAVGAATRSREVADEHARDYR